MIKDSHIYIYNDTFISLLNLIAKLLKDKLLPENIKNTYYEPNLLDDLFYLELSDNQDIISFFIKKIGRRNVSVVYKVFLSNYQDKELLIYHYILYSFKYGENTIYRKDLDEVTLVLKISKHTCYEAHKLKGFTRFKELENNVLYAEINPDNDVLFFLSIHFKKRLPNEYWIIKDVTHDIYSIYNKEDFIIVPCSEFHLSTNITSKKEELFDKMWRTFYQTIGTKERKNDRCRMNFMPKKYWKYITEMSDEL